MPSDEHDSVDPQKWKRRERSMGNGVIVWALGVAVLVYIRSDAVASWIGSTPPLEISAAILLTLGVMGGLFEVGYLARDYFNTPSEQEKLTEVPWDE